MLGQLPNTTVIEENLETSHVINSFPARIQDLSILETKSSIVPSKVGTHVLCHFLEANG